MRRSDEEENTRERLELSLPLLRSILMFWKIN